MKKLTDRIRKVWTAYGLTQSELADRMNVTTSAYGKMERKADHPSYARLSAIAMAIGVSLIFLLDTENKTYMEDKYNL